jgi:hypothetical protein
MFWIVGLIILFAPSEERTLVKERTEIAGIRSQETCPGDRVVRSTHSFREIAQEKADVIRDFLGALAQRPYFREALSMKRRFSYADLAGVWESTILRWMGAPQEVLT